MAVTPVRVVAVLTHPIQYYAAWFRWLQANRPDVDLSVIYASAPTAAQQGVGFDRPFEWDVPLTDGYANRIVRPASTSDRFDAASFRGLDVPEIDDAIRDARPDVVLIFGWYSITLVRAIHAARRLGVPVLYHGDTNLQSAPRGWKFPLWVAKTRRLLGLFSGYLAVGTRSAAFFRFFGASDDRIFAAPHAVDNARFADAVALRRGSQRSAVRADLGLPADAFVVLFCGKLEEKKRPLDLVAALATMSPPPHLAIAGSGPLEPEVRTAAERAGIGLTMLGFVNQSRMASVYAAADCLALTSDGRETWGLVVNEALAAGLPCVVADSAGCAPDLGRPEIGGVYATADPVEVPQLLGAALSRVRDMAQSGHDFVPACLGAAGRHSFAAASDGLARAARAALAAASQAAAPQRVLACCGGMVLMGGLERMTFEVLRVLRQRGATIHCVVNWYDNSRIVAAAERVGASWTTGYYLYRFTLRFGTPVVAARIAWDMLRTSADLMVDAVAFRPSHVFLSDYISVIRNAPALALLRLSGRDVICRLGNAPDAGPRHRLVWRLAVNPFVDLFVCNSPFTDRELAAHGIPKRKRITIPHTPPQRHDVPAATAHDPRRLIYVGQIIPEKGLDILLDATAMLVAQGHDVRLDVVGRIDGWVPPEQEQYRRAVLARAERADLRGRVRFLGYREDVDLLMAGAGIHCCPSKRQIREGFGIVVIEAKRAGIPSVVFPSGNLPDLIAHGKDGWVCQEETPAALAEGIERLMAPETLEGAMAAARASADAFSRERFERSWTGVFAGGTT